MESGTPIQYPGYVKVRAQFKSVGGGYMWHCHILSHEENEMMRSFVVVPVGQGN
jgi:FtsP/CotA-like multicopper oxidase with cupredoxin domain